MNKVCQAKGASSGEKRPNGSACATNAACESGNCVNKVCQAQGISGHGVLGAPCKLNSECASNVCVNGVCTDRGNGKLSSNSSGLGSLAAGASCTKNAQCESGLCYNGKCSNDCERVGCAEAYYVCRANKCIPVETIGGECSLNEDCSIGYFCCNGFCSANKCEVGISCSYTDTRCNGYCSWSDYCTCDENAECGNNMYCGHDSSWGQVCYPKKQLNANCDENAECIDGLFCENYKCTQKRDLEELCRYAYQCTSGYCEDSNTKKACTSYSSCYCQPALANGKACKEDSNCQSKYCKPSTGTCENRV